MKAILFIILGLWSCEAADDDYFTAVILPHLYSYEYYFDSAGIDYDFDFLDRNPNFKVRE